MTNRFLLLVFMLLGFEVYNALLLKLDWNRGLWRGLVLLGVLVFLFGFRRWLPPVAPPSEVARRVTRWAPVALLAINLAIAGSSIKYSFVSGVIPLDQGQTTWRAARLLWKGEDPYGPGALVDFTAYPIRAQQRAAAGLAPNITTSDVEKTLEDYDWTLDPSIRRRLLPLAPNAEPASIETRILGYKYGPLLVAMTALAVPFGVPASVLMLNVLASFALLYILYRLMKLRAGPAFAELGLAALLLDRHISWNYMQLTATDVWPLLFGALGTLFYISNRNLACGASISLAFGCKIFPGVLFLPLLFAGGSVMPVVAFLVVALLTYGPFLVWDAWGVITNVFLWPVLMAPDSTAWLSVIPKWAALPIRLAVLAGVAWAWVRYLTGQESRLFWTLAIASTLVLFAGNAFHNNYMPWASIWVVLAIVEAGRRQAAARDTTASPPRLFGHPVILHV